MRIRNFVATAMIYLGLTGAGAAQVNEEVPVAVPPPPVVQPVPVPAITPPSVPPVDQDAINAALQARDRLVASGAHRIASGPCDIEPANVCDKLGDGRAEFCRPRVEAWRRECQAITAFQGDATHAQCHARCEHMASTAEIGLWLAGEALAVAEEADPGDAEMAAAQIATLREPRDAAQAELDALEAAIAARRIYIYSNSRTGETFQHHGEYFDPTPPIVFNGEMPAPPTEEQVERRAVLNALIADYDRTISEIEARENDPALADWRQVYRYTWEGGEYQGRTSDGPVACTSDEVQPELAQCIAHCNEQSPASDGGPGPYAREFCRPAATIGMLNTPLSRNWLYPPGDPRRTPGYGRDGND